MAGESRKGVALKAEEEKLTVRLRVNLTQEDHQEIMKRYDPDLYRSKSEYYRSVLLRKGEHGDIEKASSLLAGHTIALSEFTMRLNQVVLLYQHKFPFSRPDYMWKHVTDSVALGDKSKELLRRVEKLLEPRKKETVNPKVGPTKEQIARYKAVYSVLDSYRRGTATMAQVKAIPKGDLEEARNWVSQLSFEKLEADIPDFWDEAGHLA